MRLLPVLALLFACNGAPPPAPGSWPATDEAIATVDGKAVPKALVDAVMERISEEEREQIKARGDYPKFVKNVSALLEVWYARALTEKLDEDPTVRAKLAVAAREVLGQAALDKAIKAELTDERIKQAYDERSIQYARPRAHLHAIVVKDEALANELKAQLDAGADFAAVAAANSLDRTKDKGGDVGFVDKGRLPPEIDTVVFGSPVGTVAGPIETPYGWQLLMVSERKDRIELDEARPELEEKLRDEIMAEKMKEAEEAMTFEMKGEGAPVTELVPAPSLPPAPPAPPAGDSK